MRSRTNRGHYGFAHLLAVGPLDEQLRAIFAPEPREWRWSRPKHSDVAVAVSTHLLSDISCVVHRRAECPGTNDRIDQRHDRRITHRPAKFQLPIVKGAIVLFAR